MRRGNPNRIMPRTRPPAPANKAIGRPMAAEPMRRGQPPKRRLNGRPMASAQRPMTRGARQEVQMQDGSRRPIQRRPMR